MAAALAAGTLLVVTACGPDGPSLGGWAGTPHYPACGSAATAGGGGVIGGGVIGGLTLPSGIPTSLLEGLPTSWDDLKKWKFEDWDNWASKHVFNNPVVKDFWNPDKMGDSKPADPAPPTAKPTGDAGVTDPDPAPVKATPVTRPYTKQPSGKVFFSADGGRGNCSATVIADPAHPGKSNLVWTAGHCVHQGKGGSFYSNISFIPAFNSNAAMSGGKQADESQYAPFGIWGATQAVTSPQWKAEGGKTGDAATHYDFAVIRVKPADGAKSLEETVGGAVPVWFNAPRDQLSVTEYGYPAAPPFDGMELNRCESGKPGRLSYEPTRPPMLVIGCTMTGGSSGGGWLAVKDGKPALVSNVSVGKHTGDPMYQAGPYLDDVAAGAYDFLSKKG
ncbi:trypsin-like serine peptidase [Kitasatospora sp. NPDC058263]